MIVEVKIPPTRMKNPHIYSTRVRSPGGGSVLHRFRSGLGGSRGVARKRWETESGGVEVVGVQEDLGKKKWGWFDLCGRIAMTYGKRSRGPRRHEVELVSGEDLIISGSMGFGLAFFPDHTILYSFHLFECV